MLYVFIYKSKNLIGLHILLILFFKQLFHSQLICYRFQGYMKQSILLFAK